MILIPKLIAPMVVALVTVHSAVAVAAHMVTMDANVNLGKDPICNSPIGEPRLTVPEFKCIL